MQPHSFYAGLAILICGILAIVIVPSPQQPAALLERLAPRIERAQTLTPETRDTIVWLVERARERTGDPRQRDRWGNAVSRVTTALEAMPQPASIGQTMDR